MDNSKSIFNKISLKRHGKFFGFGTGPQSDWKVIFGLSLFLTLVVIGMSVFIFTKIDKGEIFVIEKPEPQEMVTLDIELLRRVALYYQERAAELDQIRIAPPVSVDPSL